MLFSIPEAFVGRDEIRAPLKTPAWDATVNLVGTICAIALGSKPPLVTRIA